jgi:hypothetical protein
MDMKSSASANLGQAGFKHITVLGIISLAGDSYGPGVACNGNNISSSWSDIFPGASFAATPEGSVTTDIFLKFLKETWLDRISEDDRRAWKVLILDSGGGGLLHLSLDLYRFFEHYRVRAYFLSAYCTKAFMPLDQTVHQQAKQRWTKHRLVVGRSLASLSVAKALDIVREICRSVSASVHHSKLGCHWHGDGCAYQSG